MAFMAAVLFNAPLAQATTAVPAFTQQGTTQVCVSLDYTKKKNTRIIYGVAYGVAPGEIEIEQNKIKQGAFPVTLTADFKFTKALEVLTKDASGNPYVVYYVYYDGQVYGPVVVGKAVQASRTTQCFDVPTDFDLNLTCDVITCDKVKFQSTIGGAGKITKDVQVEVILSNGNGDGNHMVDTIVEAQASFSVDPVIVADAADFGGNPKVSYNNNLLGRCRDLASAATAWMLPQTFAQYLAA
jgi:hypothetical protein